MYFEQANMGVILLFIMVTSSVSYFLLAFLNCPGVIPVYVLKNLEKLEGSYNKCRAIEAILSSEINNNSLDIFSSRSSKRSQGDLPNTL